jgi:hypothetical protein
MELMAHQCQLLGWVCKACMMVVAILRLGVAMALGRGDHMTPMVIHTRNWTSGCSLAWTVPFLL